MFGKKKKSEHERIGSLSAKEREIEYREGAVAGWERSWTILHDTEDWRLDKGTDLTTGIVHSKHYKDLGRVSRLRVLEKVSEDLDIHYIVNQGKSQVGVIARRDYVNARLNRTKDGKIFNSGCPTAHPSKPPVKKIVRGQTKAGGWAFSAVDGQPDKTLFEWLMCIDIGGWFPQFAVDQGIASSMLEFVESCKKKIAQIKQDAAQ